MLSAVGAEASPDTTRTVGTAVHAVAQQVAEGLPPADAPAVLAAELDQLDLGPGWSDQRQRQSAQDMLDRFLAWHAAGGRELVGVEVEFDATVGRALHPRPGRPARARRRRAGWWSSTSRPGKTPAKNTEEHGQLAAYQVAVAAGGFGEHGTVPGGAALLQVGTGAKAKEQHQEPAARRRAARPRPGPGSCCRGRRGHGRRRPSRCAPARTASAARRGAAARCRSPAGR